MFDAEIHVFLFSLQGFGRVVSLTFQRKSPKTKRSKKRFDFKLFVVTIWYVIEYWMNTARKMSIRKSLKSRDSLILFRVRMKGVHEKEELNSLKMSWLKKVGGRGTLALILGSSPHPLHASDHVMNPFRVRNITKVNMGRYAVDSCRRNIHANLSLFSIQTNWEGISFIPFH